MKKNIIIIIFAILMQVASASEPARTILINYHDAQSTMTFDRNNSQFFTKLPAVEYGKSYATTIKIPFSWTGREYFLHIEDAASGSIVYVNDSLVGQHFTAKSHTEYDITKFVKEGVNTLRLEQKSNDPLYSGSINKDSKGDVYVTAEPKLRVRDCIVSTKFSDDMNRGALDLAVILKSHFMNPKSVSVICDLYTPDGTLITSYKNEVNFKNFSEDTIHFTSLIPDVEAWSSETPQLYTAVLKVFYDNRYSQYVPIKFGFREIAITNNDLLINRKKATLKGIEFEYTVNPERKLTELKERGINALWIKDRPYGESFYRMCDTMGFYVFNMAELSGSGNGSGSDNDDVAENPKYTNAVIDRIINMYDNSKNHPSVVGFVMGSNINNGFNMQEGYLKLKERESERPIILSSGAKSWNSDIAVSINNYDTKITDRFQIITDIDNSAKEMLDDKNLQGGFFKNTSGKEIDLRELSIEPLNIESFSFMVTSDMNFFDLSDFNMNYTVITKGKSVKTGTIPLTGEKMAVEIPMSDVRLKKGKETILTLTLEPKNKTMKSYKRDFKIR